jgi:hypothetical protein
MPLPHLLQHVAKQPSMYFNPVEFDVAAAFLQGFDLANSGGVLVGFREWLVVKLGYGSNLIWSALALQLLFPESESPRQSLVDSGDQKRAVELLFGIVEEFWQERESLNGLRRIYLKYQTWLQRQEWYGPTSPDYFADASNP